MFGVSLPEEKYTKLKDAMRAKSAKSNGDVVDFYLKAAGVSSVDPEAEKAKMMERLLSLKADAAKLEATIREDGETFDAINEAFGKLKEETPGKSETDRQLAFIETKEFPGDKVVIYLRYRKVGVEYAAVKAKIAALSAKPADTPAPTT